ncbi:hypothetical protein [Micromonospora sp. KLBMP9576]|uniref:hypothetical protein n=1 Tax=Micromonospora sp. KLBMP9576 TaxID=3424769 RepID=UPI003D94F35C
MNPGDVTVPPPADGAEDRLAVLRGWWRLPAPARREVRLLSRSGRHHPDREVAWVAWRWAQVVLPPGAPEPGRARNKLSAAGFWVLILLELVTGVDPTDPPEPRWLDRRRARRILRAGPPLR